MELSTWSIDLVSDQCDSSFAALFVELISTAPVDSLSVRVEGCLLDEATRTMEARFSSGLGLVATEMLIVSMAIDSSHRLNFGSIRIGFLLSWILVMRWVFIPGRRMTLRSCQVRAENNGAIPKPFGWG